MSDKIKSFETLKEIIKEWPIWLGIIFLFIPGVMYQISIAKVNLANYEGLLVIIFLIKSIYYSLPFIVLGGIIYILSKISSKEKNNQKSDFFSFSMATIIMYGIAEISIQDLGKTLFWQLYVIMLVIAVFATIIFAIIYNRKKNSKNKKEVKVTKTSKHMKEKRKIIWFSQRDKSIFGYFFSSIAGALIAFGIQKIMEEGFPQGWWYEFAGAFMIVLFIYSYIDKKSDTKK